MSKTVTGDAVSFDGGTFQLRCTVAYTTTAIKFKPYVVVTQAMQSPHKAWVGWTPAGQKQRSYDRTVQSAATYYIPEDKAWQTNSDYSIRVACTLGSVAGVSGSGVTSEVILTSDVKPAKPSLIVRRQNDQHYTVTINGRGKGSAVPANTVTLQRQTDTATASWSNLATRTPSTTGDYSFTIDDQTTERGHRYRWRVQVANQAGNSGYVVTGWKYTSPPDISNVTHVRVSNTTNRLMWTRDAGAADKHLFTGFQIQRRRNDNAWTNYKKVGVGSLNDTQLVYLDENCAVDNYYRYRIKPYNSDVVSQYEAPSTTGTTATYNTPKAPKSVKATYRINGNVRLVFENESVTATGMEIERKIDSGDWTNVATLNTTPTTWLDETTVSGSVVKYRARNTRSDLPEADRVSPWRVSNQVLALSKPGVPTLVDPAPRSAFTVADSTVRLVWVHNPTDGTEQESATVQYREDSIDTWTSVTVGAVSYYDLDVTQFGANDRILWRVSTKGAYATASDYSPAQSFSIYGVPTLTVTSPDNGDEIDNLPLTLGWTYADESGTLASLTLNILKDGETVYTKDLPTNATSYSLADYVFDNETAYQLNLVALSSTGLSAADAVGITISYVPVRLTNGLFPDVRLDAETGYATVTLSADVSPNETADPDADEPIIVNSGVAAAYLYRIAGGKRTLIGSGLSEGDEIVDMYCPINAPFSYELLMVANSGQIALAQVDEFLESTYFYCYWYNNVARAQWNPSGSVAITRPEKTQVRYSGRVYPVTYDSTAMEQTFSLSCVIADRAELDAFMALMRSGGSGVWKSADGDVYAADFSFSYAAEYYKNRIVWKASLDVTRIDSEDL